MAKVVFFLTVFLSATGLFIGCYEGNRISAPQENDDSEEVERSSRYAESRRSRRSSSRRIGGGSSSGGSSSGGSSSGGSSSGGSSSGGSDDGAGAEKDAGKVEGHRPGRGCQQGNRSGTKGKCSQ